MYVSFNQHESIKIVNNANITMINYLDTQTIFSHVGWLHDPRICRIYPMGPTNIVRYSFTIYAFKLTLGILGGFIPTLFT